LKKVKTAAGKENVQAKRKELEKLLEKNLKKYEPTISKFVAEVNKNAKKAGVDLTDLEKKVRDNLHTARTRLAKASATVKTRTAVKGKKAAPAKKAAAPAKKAAPGAKKAAAAAAPASVANSTGHE
jgi:flagellar hook-basal body complex protein FliE